VTLADEYGVPKHELLARWDGREIQEIYALRKLKNDEADAALKEKENPAENLTRQQTPDEIFAMLDA
jgi:hypothetical protein